MQWVNRGVQVLLAASLMAFLLLPTIQDNLLATWAGILLITGCALYLSLLYRDVLTTWHSFSVLTMLIFLALAWFRWQWSTWLPFTPYSQRINLAIGLLTWTLLIALFVSSILLLVRKDASIVFMALSWVLLPMILIAVGNQYPDLTTFYQAPLSEQAFWGVPLLWAFSMLCLGPLAFLGHFLVLLTKELKNA